MFDWCFSFLYWCSAFQARNFVHFSLKVNRHKSMSREENGFNQVFLNLYLFSRSTCEEQNRINCFMTCKPCWDYFNHCTGNVNHIFRFTYTASHPDKQEQNCGYDVLTSGSHCILPLYILTFEPTLQICASFQSICSTGSISQVNHIQQSYFAQGGKPRKCFCYICYSLHPNFNFEQRICRSKSGTLARNTFCTEKLPISLTSTLSPNF